MQREAPAVTGAPDRDSARPRIGRDREPLQGLGLSAHRRQIEYDASGPARHGWGPLPARRRRSARSREHGRLDGAGRDASRRPVGDAGDAMEPRPGLGRHGQDVAGFDRDLARRERKLRALAPGPEILEPSVRKTLRLGTARHDGRINAGLAAA